MHPHLPTATGTADADAMMGVESVNAMDGCRARYEDEAGYYSVQPRQWGH